MSAENGKIPLYRAADVRELDRIAIEQYGIDGFSLMQRAGRAAFEVLRETWPDVKRINVFCGSGNNAGDGYVIAESAHQHGLEALIWYIKAPDELRGSARRAAGEALSAGVPVRRFQPGVSLMGEGTTVLVDALLGTGLSGPVREDYREAITCINQSGLPVLAVDIPSGLDGDSGRPMGAAVRADVTVSFIGMKLGLARGAGPDHCGMLVYRDLGVPGEIFNQVTPAGWMEQPSP